MGYEIEALAAKETLLRKHQAVFRNAYVVPLPQAFGLIPMIDALYQEAAGPGEKRPAGLHGFSLLPPAVAAWAEQASREGPVAYFEAGYFGGLGSQQALVWQNGAIAAGPLYGDAINQALRYLGVTRSDPQDEFDTLALGQHRQTEPWAASAIVDELQGHAAGGLPGLIEALTFEHPSPSLKNLVRDFAANRLKAMGPEAKPALPALAQRARLDENYGVCLSAACALAALGPDALPALVAALGDENNLHRSTAAYALSKLGAGAQASVPALIQAMSDTQARVRIEAARALGKIGPEARSALARLSQALTDENEFVRQAAGSALKKIMPGDPS